MRNGETQRGISSCDLNPKGVGAERDRDNALILERGSQLCRPTVNVCGGVAMTSLSDTFQN